MNFKEWWKSHKINKSDLQPIMKEAFKELAEDAWNYALTNTVSASNLPDSLIITDPEKYKKEFREKIGCCHEHPPDKKKPIAFKYKD